MSLESTSNRLWPYDTTKNDFAKVNLLSFDLPVASNTAGYSYSLKAFLPLVSRTPHSPNFSIRFWPHLFCIFFAGSSLSFQTSKCQNALRLEAQFFLHVTSLSTSTLSVSSFNPTALKIIYERKALTWKSPASFCLHNPHQCILCLLNPQFPALSPRPIPVSLTLPCLKEQQHHWLSQYNNADDNFLLLLP